MPLPTTDVMASIDESLQVIRRNFLSLASIFTQGQQAPSPVSVTGAVTVANPTPPTVLPLDSAGNVKVDVVTGGPAGGVASQAPQQDQSQLLQQILQGLQDIAEVIVAVAPGTPIVNVAPSPAPTVNVPAPVVVPGSATESTLQQIAGALVQIQQLFQDLAELIAQVAPAPTIIPNPLPVSVTNAQPAPTLSVPSPLPVSALGLSAVGPLLAELVILSRAQLIVLAQIVDANMDDLLVLGSQGRPVANQVLQ